jgi:hypothetical protein
VYQLSSIFGYDLTNPKGHILKKGNDNLSERIVDSNLGLSYIVLHCNIAKNVEHGKNIVVFSTQQFSKNFVWSGYTEIETNEITFNSLQFWLSSDRGFTIPIEKGTVLVSGHIEI